MTSQLLVAALAVFLLAGSASAQSSSQLPISGSTWVEVFVGPDGTVLYPQYAWATDGLLGNLSGYGFVEEAPREPFFTNHLVVYCPPKSPLCAHTETGGAPGRDTFHIQAGPRINVHTLVPALRKTLTHLFVTQLPGFVGGRPPNTLLAGGTKKFRVAPKLTASIEGYRRFFPGERPDYSEYWLLLHPEWRAPVGFGTFVLHDGRSVVWAAGVRYTLCNK